MEVLRRIFNIFGGSEKNVIGRRLFDAGGIDISGGAEDFLCDGQFFKSHTVIAVFRQGIPGNVYMDG